ncbi:MAG TPA: hypothetical protein VKR06_07560 [Ktedonosporobacter sp.]|nr:hypothetical protein [Ktedonosporobacter sp.]
MMHPDFNQIIGVEHRQALQREAEMESLVRQLDVGTGGRQHVRDMVIRGVAGVGLAAFGLGLLFGGLVVEAAGLVPIALLMAGISLFIALPLLIRTFRQFLIDGYA